jgi:hypothetical protein
MVPTQSVAIYFNCRSITTKLQQGGGEHYLCYLPWNEVELYILCHNTLLSYHTHSWYILMDFFSFCIELTLIILNMRNINYDIMRPNPPYQHLKQTLVDNAYYWKPHMEVNVNILIPISIAFHLWMDFIKVFLSCIHLFHSNC